MLFWIVAALLTLCACLSVLLPVARSARRAAADVDFDLEVYQDQLAELDRDMARGVIARTEAEQARAEIGRRILRLAGEGRQAGEKAGGRLGRVVVTLAVLAVPAASWSIYAATGSPYLPAQPLHARLGGDPAEGSVEELVARAESHLAANPGDGRGWDVLAPIYYRMGRYQDAEIAYRNAIRLLGATAAREIGAGEAIAASAGGTVTTEAQAAFERALVLEPDNPRAQFMLATAFAQEGRYDEAAHAWRAMQDGLAPDSPWRGVVAQALAQLDERTGGTGPTTEEMEAASLMSDKDRAEMIGEMVAGLDRRLRDNPQDPEGWRRLVQSYVVLGRLDEAGDALARGLEALGRDSEAGGALVAFAAERGVSVKE